MWSIFIFASPGTMESLSTELWEMGTAGILEEANGLRAFFEESVERESICSKLASTEAATRHEAPFDTSQILPVECDPVLIGQRFYVAPSWMTDPTPVGRIRLTIDTTSAFGSGRHESTQLCMEALEEHLKPTDFVADIGCGSGILAAAATALGAATVMSCDIHQGSVLTARTLIQTPLFVGSADGIRGQSADLVLANLSLKVLDIVARDLQRIVKPTGIIVLAGFLHENRPKQFRPRDVTRKGDWECWICRAADVYVSGEAEEDPAPHTQQWWL